MNNKNLLIILYKARDYQKDPDPEHWRTISGAKVHLDNNGEIDGGAGGKFTGNYWDGQKGAQHIIGPHNMIKRNIATGATEMGLPKLRFFNRTSQQNNTTSKENKTEVKKETNVKANTGIKDFVFPKEKPIQVFKLDEKEGKLWQRELLKRIAKGEGSQQVARTYLSDLNKWYNIPTEQMKTPETQEEIQEDLGSAFTRASKARKKPFGAKEINKYKEISELFKNADPHIVKAAIAGINIESIDLEPADAYKLWLKAGETLRRVEQEKRDGIKSDFEAWRNSLRTKSKEGKKQAHDAEVKTFETKERLKEYVKHYKPDSVVGVPKGPDMTFDEADGKKANPHYSLLSNNVGYTKNCQSCVVAFEMRLRGFNVEALPKTKGNNPFQDTLASNESWRLGCTKAWVTDTGEHPITKEFPDSNYNNGAEDIYNWIDQTVNEGERHFLTVLWRGKGYGHIVCVSKKDGEITIYDPQDGQLLKGSKKCKQILKDVSTGSGMFDRAPALMRVDNCYPDMFYVNRVLKKAGT